MGWAACLGESMLQLPRVGVEAPRLLKRSLTRLYYCCCCRVVNYSKRIIIVRGADLSEFLSLIFVGKMCVFVSRPMKIASFLRKNGETPKRVVDFPMERDTFRNKIREIVWDFNEQSYNNNGKPWKSSRILRVKPNFFIFSPFIMFRHFFRFLFHFISLLHFFSVFSVFFFFFSFFFSFCFVFFSFFNFFFFQFFIFSLPF